MRHDLLTLICMTKKQRERYWQENPADGFDSILERRFIEIHGIIKEEIIAEKRKGSKANDQRLGNLNLLLSKIYETHRQILESDPTRAAYLAFELSLNVADAVAASRLGRMTVDKRHGSTPTRKAAVKKALAEIETALIAGKHPSWRHSDFIDNARRKHPLLKAREEAKQPPRDALWKGTIALCEKHNRPVTGRKK